MAGIDKTYIHNYAQYKEVYDWCKDKEVTLKNEVTFKPLDFLYEITEEEFNNNKKEWIEKNLKFLSKKELEKNYEFPIWNTPLYFDIWLIRNCPINFIQDRLKQQYKEEYDQIKNYTSVYDTYQRNGVGNNFHYKVIKKPKYKILSSEKLYITIEVKDFNNNSLLFDEENNYWSDYREAVPFNTSIKDMYGKNLSIYSIIRMIKKWNLPNNSQVIINIPSYEGWIIKVYK